MQKTSAEELVICLRCGCPKKNVHRAIVHCEDVQTSGSPSCVIVHSSGQNRDAQPQTILHISYIFKQSYTDTNHIILYCSISFIPNHTSYYCIVRLVTIFRGVGLLQGIVGFQMGFGFCLSGSPPRLLHLYVGLCVAATGLVTRVRVAALALKAALRGGSQPQLAILAPCSALVIPAP